MSEGEVFIGAFNLMSAEVHQNSIDKGFWPQDKSTRNAGELIALMHSELSECLEGSRDGNPPDKHLPQFNSMEVELADTVIRIMDCSAGLGLRVAEALIAKKNFNASRPHKHGKKF